MVAPVASSSFFFGEVVLLEYWLRVQVPASSSVASSSKCSHRSVCGFTSSGVVVQAACAALLPVCQGCNIYLSPSCLVPIVVVQLHGWLHSLCGLVLHLARRSSCRAVEARNAAFFFVRRCSTYRFAWYGGPEGAGRCQPGAAGTRAGGGLLRLLRSSPAL